MKKKSILVTKAAGYVVPFSEEKLKTSLMRAGADKRLTDDILSTIKPQLYDGIPTKEIYKMAFTLLKADARHVAAKYHLKNGIMELGPSGYAFEKYLGEILKRQGYKTTIGEIVQGKCVTHEVDVIAEKGNEYNMIECKYHNLPGNVSNVKVPLYIQSRFKDLESVWVGMKSHESKFHQGWVVTNTRFTSDAIQYGNCAGLKLLGWDYPHKGSLKDQVDSLGLYPLTCLTSLTKAEKSALLEKDIVLCQEVCKNEKLLHAIGVKQARIKLVMDEVEQLCQSSIKKSK